MGVVRERLVRGGSRPDQQPGLAWARSSRRRAMGSLQGSTDPLNYKSEHGDYDYDYDCDDDDVPQRAEAQRWRKQWNARFKELIKYKSEHGDCNVPIRQGKLGTWVSTQRNRYMAGSLQRDRIERLDVIGFNWALKEAVSTVPWETRFKELVQYKAEHGGCNVPSGRENSERGWIIKGLLTRRASYHRIASTGSTPSALIGKKT